MSRVSVEASRRRPEPLFSAPGGWYKTVTTLQALGLLLALGTAVPRQGQAQAPDLHTIVNALAPLRSPVRSALVPADTSDTAVADACKEAQDLLDFLEALITQEDLQSGLRGSVNAGLNADDASSSADESRSKVTLTSEIELARGSYRNEVELRSGLSVDLRSSPVDSKDPTLQENVSNVALSYDRYWYPWTESFVFLNRFSDEFLSIDERYEAGGGFKFIAFRGGGMPDTWLQKVGRMTVDSTNATRWRTFGHAPDLARPNYLGPDARWPRCLEAVLKRAEVPDSAASNTIRTIQNQFDALDTRRRDAVESIVKEQSKIAVSIAFGAFVEVQQHTLKTSGAQLARLAGISRDSLFSATQVRADSTLSLTLPAARDYDWELRPTIQWYPYEHLRVRGDFYIKYPFSADSLGHKPRTDLETSLTWEGDGGVTMKLSYQRLAESRPPTRPLADFVDTLVGVLPANRRHHIVKMQFGVKF